MSEVPLSRLSHGRWLRPVSRPPPARRGTSLIIPPPLLGPYSRTIPSVPWWSWGGEGGVLVSEVPLWRTSSSVRELQVLAAEIPLQGVLVRGHAGLVINSLSPSLSDTVCFFISFRKSIPPQNHQPNILIGDSKQ